jgi:hypothetical protein
MVDNIETMLGMIVAPFALAGDGRAEPEFVEPGQF